jgi:hypothetical protein
MAIVADASYGLRRRFTRNFAGGRELNDGRSMAIDLPPPNLPGISISFCF